MNKPGALLLLVALLLGGCRDDSLDPSSCDTSLASPPCPTNETCPGQCVSLPPLGWSRPVLVWSGSQLEAPECSTAGTGVLQYEGYADPIDRLKCPVCGCEPPTGECALPFLTASTQTCVGTSPGPIIHDFSGLDPDPTSCNTDNAVAPVQGPKSLIFGPLTLTESECKPVTTLPPPRTGAASWKTFVRACSYGVSPCANPGTVCVPTAEPPPGHSQCIYHPGKHDCPSSYPNRRVFYDQVSDSRQCSACACGAPEGGDCKAFVESFQDALCTVQAAARTIHLQEACSNLFPNTGLGGKKATPPTYEPGVCEPSGGELTGSLELMGPSTFCCQ